jgi:hypothetical protein
VSPRLALILGALGAFAVGLALTVFPATMLGGFGLKTPDEAIVLARDEGVTLIGLGLINWMAQSATGTPLRALLAGNLAVQALEILVNGFELVAGMLPIQAAPGLLIHLVLGAIFVLAMTRVR